MKNVSARTTAVCWMAGHYTPQTSARRLALAVAGIIITAVLLICSQTPLRAATAEELARFDHEDSYVADGQTVQVQRVPDEVVVRFDSTDAPVEAATRWSRSSGQALTPVRKIAGQAALCRIPPDGGQDAMTTGLNALKADATVRYVYPVYRTSNGKRFFLNDEVIVRLKEKLEPKDLAILTELGLISRDTLSSADSIYKFKLTRPKAQNPLKLCATLRAAPEVVWAEPNFSAEIEQHATTPNDSYFSWQWHHKNTGILPQTPSVTDADIDSDDAWDSGYGSVGIRIAILDDGVQTNHPDLDDNIVAGYDFYDNDANPNPSESGDNHGTTVAGIAAAETNNSLLVAGVAGKCKLLPVRMVEAGIAATVDQIYRALLYAADNADVINCSWGITYSGTIQSGLVYASGSGRGGKGCVVLGSSGNSASGDGQYSYDHLESYNIYAAIGAGKYYLDFEYVKDASVSEGDDAVWLAEVAVPKDGLAGSYIYTFETVGEQNEWTSGGSASWSYGVDAEHSHGLSPNSVRSGAISHNQLSYLRSPLLDITSVKTTVYFRRWMSCQSLDKLMLRVRHKDTLAVLVSATFGGGQPANRTTSVAFPANNAYALAVGGSTDKDYRSDFSRYGSELDLVAPTTGGFASPTSLFAVSGSYVPGIATTDRTGADGYNTLSGTNGDYFFLIGTTCSAAVAAGATALVLSRDGNLTRSTTVDKLIQNCEKKGPLSYTGSPSRNDYYGHGRLNANASVDATTLDTTAPTFSTAKVMHYRAVDVTFNEPMGDGALTAGNYSITAGAGTLSSNPSTVIRIKPTVYRLIWNSGDMATSGTVTIQASSSIKDIAGNALTTTSKNSTGTKRVIGINCGNRVDSNAYALDYTPPFISDNGFQGNEAAPFLTTASGSFSTSGYIDMGGVTDPAPGEVYQSYRTSWTSSPGSSITYSFPNMPSGNLTVRLHFCEFYFSYSQAQIFNIYINSTLKTSSFDIYASAGGMSKAIVQQYTSITAQAGVITVTITPQQNPWGSYNGVINGIEIVKP